jgi:hypothetical protein
MATRGVSLWKASLVTALLFSFVGVVAAQKADPPAASLAAERPEDLAGWRSVKWGMTVEQAKATLGDEAEVTSEETAKAAGRTWEQLGLVERLRIPRYDLLPTRVFQVSMGFSVTKGLQLVQVSSRYPNEELAQVLGSKPSSAKERQAWLLADARCESLNGTGFDVLATRLTEKYGPPSERKRTSVGPQATWTLTHTVISLRAGSGLYLTYQPRASAGGSDRL